MSIRRSIVKHTIGLTVSFGTGAIVAGAALHFTPVGMGRVMTFSTRVAAVALGGMVGEKTGLWAEQTIDQFADFVAGVRKFGNDVGEAVANAVVPESETVVVQENKPEEKAEKASGASFGKTAETRADAKKA